MASNPGIQTIAVESLDAILDRHSIIHEGIGMSSNLRDEVEQIARDDQLSHLLELPRTSNFISPR
jgi:hypothetical protein